MPSSSRIPSAGRSTTWSFASRWATTRQRPSAATAESRLSRAYGAGSIALQPNTTTFNGYYSYNQTWQAGQTFTTHAGTRVNIDWISAAAAGITVTAPPAITGVFREAWLLAGGEAGLGYSTSGVTCPYGAAASTTCYRLSSAASSIAPQASAPTRSRTLTCPAWKDAGWRAGDRLPHRHRKLRAGTAAAATSPSRKPTSTAPPPPGPTPSPEPTGTPGGTPAGRQASATPPEHHLRPRRRRLPPALPESQHLLHRRHRRPRRHRSLLERLAGRRLAGRHRLPHRSTLLRPDRRRLLPALHRRPTSTAPPPPAPTPSPVPTGSALAGRRLAGKHRLPHRAPHLRTLRRRLLPALPGGQHLLDPRHRSPRRHRRLLERLAGRRLAGEASATPPGTSPAASRRRLLPALHNGGNIYWTSATGAHAVTGAYWNAWRAAGFGRRSIGYPTGTVTCGLYGGGCYQPFKGGSIYWTPLPPAPTP